MYTQADAKAGILAEWRTWRTDRPSRTSTEMFIFYLKLERAGSRWLHFRCSGDKWQHVHSWLAEPSAATDKLLQPYA